MLDIFGCIQQQKSLPPDSICSTLAVKGRIFAAASSSMSQIARQTSPETINKAFGNLLTTTLAGLILWVLQSSEDFTFSRVLRLTSIWIGIPLGLYLLVLLVQQSQPLESPREGSPGSQLEVKQVHQKKAALTKPSKPSKSSRGSRSISPTCTRTQQHGHNLAHVGRAASDPSDKSLPRSQSPSSSTACSSSSNMHESVMDLRVAKPRRTSSLCPMKRAGSNLRRRLSSDDEHSYTTHDPEKVRTTFHLKALIPGGFKRHRRGSIA